MGIGIATIQIEKLFRTFKIEIGVVAVAEVAANTLGDRITAEIRVMIDNAKRKYLHNGGIVREEIGDTDIDKVNT